ncbi:MAG: ABC transporter ATP-binding protein [Lachnospiraceae bacterium]|nr:ABC transporter ATP-binding protein [Lachnospiraceae bacterium]
MKLPESFYEVIKGYGIAKDEILFGAMADLDMEYRFADTVVALTKEKLLVAAYPYREKQEYRMGGYGGLQQDLVLMGKPALKIFSLEQVESLKVLRQISTGVLMGVIDGKDQLICHFSNTKQGYFHKMEELLKKIKEKEEIKEEDLDVEKGKEACPKCGMVYPDQERKVCPKCMDKKSVLLRILSYFKPYKPQLAIMVVCYLGNAGLNMAWPYLSGSVLYDKVLSKNEDFVAFLGLPAGSFFAALTVVVIAMILAKAIGQFFGIMQGVMTAKVAPKVVGKIKSQVFASMGRLSISFFSRRQTGGLMTRVCDDAEEVSHFFIDGVPYFFINVISLTATIIIMFVLSPVLALASVFLMPILVVLSYRMLPHLWHYYGKRHRANKKMNSQINENLTGARVVKAFGREKQEIGRFGKNNKRVQTTDVELAVYDNKFFALYYTVEDTLSFLVWAVGGALMISGFMAAARGGKPGGILTGQGISLGLLLTFSGYVGQLKGPLEFMSHILRWYTNCMNCGQRLFEIIDAVPEVREVKDPYRPKQLRGEIELKNVTFGYEPHKPILKDISFHVKPGEVFGIVGRSGSGKSTLVNLISRLYDAEEGEVLVDGVNVKKFGFRELRRNVAMVSQETYIFVGTVAENIAYARPDASREEIIAAAKQASAHDFICKMPLGYDTMLGSSERALSGGEKQRISIARAILADPKILILDEATSAVDTETELAIQKSLERLEKGRTVISIAHRLSTLRNATHLIVLDEGKLTESGTHEELMALKGTFFKLNELQTKALAMRGLD